MVEVLFRPLLSSSREEVFSEHKAGGAHGWDDSQLGMMGGGCFEHREEPADLARGFGLSQFQKLLVDLHVDPVRFRV